MPKAINLVGEKYGKLVVIKRANKKSRYGIVWECLCDCGNRKIVASTSLRNGNTRSCGCLYQDAYKRSIKDLSGQRFGKLLVIEATDERRNKSVVWKCLCDCGSYSYTSSSCLARGKTKSCGCQRNFVRKRKPYQEASFNALLIKYKHRANKKEIPFHLSREQFKHLTSQNCFYCGIEPKQVDINENYNGLYTHNGIDRLNNLVGYTLDNCVPCCKQCNYAKNTMSIDEFYSWIDRIIKYQENKEE